MSSSSTGRNEFINRLRRKISARDWSDVSLTKLEDPAFCQSLLETLQCSEPVVQGLRASSFRIHLAKLFEKLVQEVQMFTHCGDLSLVTASQDATVRLTPDLFDPEEGRWGDAAISRNPKRTSGQKLTKYEKLLVAPGDSFHCYIFDYEKTVVLHSSVHAHDASQLDIDMDLPHVDQLDWAEQAGEDDFRKHPFRNIHYHHVPLRFERTDLTIDESFEQEQLRGLVNGMRVFNILEPEPIGPESTRSFAIQNLSGQYCSEVEELSKNDGGVLNQAVNSLSYDSQGLLQNIEACEERANHLSTIHLRRAMESEEVFKGTKRHDLLEAYRQCEAAMQGGKYDVMSSAKVSIHIPVMLPDSPLLSSDGDTKERCYQKAVEGFNHPGDQLFSSVYKTLITPTTSGKKASKKDVHLQRDGLQLSQNSPLSAEMRIGHKKNHQVLGKVKTVPFWIDGVGSQTEAYIRQRLTEAQSIVYSPHRCKQPEFPRDSERAGRLYNRFLKTKLFQECGLRSDLAKNILTAGLKQRSRATFVSAGSDNCFVLVGKSEGLINAGVEVPFVCVTKQEIDDSITPRIISQANGWSIHQAERLDKVRLKAISISARLAAIVSTIVFTQMDGTDEELLFAAGVLTCVAMSTSIRDSGLIDHLRYMIPNIFADRSCAAAYISEKLSVPLKTNLQAYLYQQMKKTILAAASQPRHLDEQHLDEGELEGGGSKININLFGCHVDSVFKLNGIVYSMFFTCAKGLHNPEQEKLKMLNGIMEYNQKSDGKTLSEASFQGGYHSFDPEFMLVSMVSMLNRQGSPKTWRARLDEMESLMKPHELKTFSSLRSSLLPPVKKDKATSRSKRLNRLKKGGVSLIEKINESWKEIYSDGRTKVVDQFFDEERPIIDIAYDALKDGAEPGFYVTWDQKLQRTERDREVFVLDKEGKSFMFVIESLFKVICKYTSEEMITMPGDRKILSMKSDSVRYYQAIKEATKNGTELPVDFIRSSEDMTKWAPGDNLCKFFYCISACYFLTGKEKVFFMNVLATSLRKKIVINEQATNKIGLLVHNGVVNKGNIWCGSLKADYSGERVLQFENNLVPTRLNWLMGVLNMTSSAAHVAVALRVRRCLELVYGELILFTIDAHSDDADSSVVCYNRTEHKLMDLYPKIKMVCLSDACIRISEKKTYFDRYYYEFVSQVNDNGMSLSYWQKQAPAVITGNSYKDFYSDLSSEMSKVANLCSLGAPPSVAAVSMCVGIDHAFETYGMLPTQANNPSKVLGVDQSELPLELGGIIDVNPYLLPFVGIKYHTFKKMVQAVEAACTPRMGRMLNVWEMEESDIPEETPGPVHMNVWAESLELAIHDGCMMQSQDSPLIRFNNFSNKEAVEKLRLFKSLKTSGFTPEVIESIINEDPILPLRKSESTEEKQKQLAILVQKPGFYNAATNQSPNQLYLERLYNRYKPCCRPALVDAEEGGVMESGTMTLKEALISAFNALRKKACKMVDCLKLVKSMPLMMFIYKVEKTVTFKYAGKKSLTPVRKSNVIRDRFVENNVLDLLRFEFKGQSTPYLKHEFLAKDLQVLRQLASQMTSLTRPQKVQALHSILSHTAGYNSVMYVPGNRYRGYKAVTGMLGNSYSDVANFLPTVPVEEPRLPGLDTFDLVDPCDQVSSLACGLFRLLGSREKVEEVLLNSTIKGEDMISFLEREGPRNRRSTAYACYALDMPIPALRPKSLQLQYLVPQRYSAGKWGGPFTVYMAAEDPHIGTRGIIFMGEDRSITEIYLTNPVNEYIDISNLVNTFCQRMHFKGHLASFAKNQLVDANQLSLKIQSFSNFSTQCSITRGGSGIPVYNINQPGSVQTPRTICEGMTNWGLEVVTVYGEHDTELSRRVMRQRMHDIPDIKINSNVSLGIWNMNSFIHGNWEAIKDIRHKISDLANPVYLNDQRTCFTTKKGEFTTWKESTELIQYFGQLSLRIEDVLNYVTDPTILPVMDKLADPFPNWTARDMHVYASCQYHQKNWQMFRVATLIAYKKRVELKDVGVEILDKLYGTTIGNEMLAKGSYVWKKEIDEGPDMSMFDS